MDASRSTMQRDGGARGVDLLRARVAEAEAELERPALDGSSETEEEESGPGYVLFVWSPSGYALLTRSGAPPPVGTEIGVSGGRLVVVKLGPSPLPGDSRRCAFLDAP